MCHLSFSLTYIHTHIYINKYTNIYIFRCFIAYRIMKWNCTQCMWNGLLTTFPQSTEWKGGEAVSLFSPGLTHSQHKDFCTIHIPTAVRGSEVIIKPHGPCLCYSHSNSNSGLQYMQIRKVKFFSSYPDPSHQFELVLFVRISGAPICIVLNSSPCIHAHPWETVNFPQYSF